MKVKRVITDKGEFYVDKIDENISNMFTTLFDDRMQEKTKDTLSIKNKKLLRDLTRNGQMDVLWIYDSSEIVTFYQRNYKYDEIYIQTIMKNYYISDIYQHIKYKSDILVILSAKK